MDDTTETRTPDASDLRRLYKLGKRLLKARHQYEVAKAQLDTLTGHAAKPKHPMYLDRSGGLERAYDRVVKIESEIIDLVLEIAGEAPGGVRVGNLVFSVVADAFDPHADHVASIVDLGSVIRAAGPTSAVA